jgi:glucosylceramidase
MPTSRRDFLKSATAATTAIAMERLLSSQAAAANAASTRPIQTMLTDAAGNRFAPAHPVAWAAPTSAPAIEIDTAIARQTILGFGCAFTDAACLTLNRLTESARAALFHEMFSPAQMGLSVCRLCIGSSDYTTEMYSYDEGSPDPDLKRFSIDHDRRYVLPILRQARVVNPDLFLFASPWSPPGWMKYSNSMLGGSIHPYNTGVYSQYILKFLQAYESAGVHVNAITIQNEIDTDQDGSMPACTWPEEVEARYIADNLGPLIRKSAPQTKIWILDHNYDLVGRVLDQLSRASVRKYVDAIAWHGYAGSPDQMSVAQAAYPHLDMHWTEGGSSFDSPDYLTDWTNWAETFTTILNNGCTSITTWNLALDQQGKPNIGPFHCGGAVTINSQSAQITRSGLFWALRHFATAFRRGAKIVETKGDIPGVSHIAAQNIDGSLNLVLANQAAQSIQIRLKNKSVTVRLPDNSITTLSLT